ncbi:MAG TPA: ATP-binding cassette domain-containing protein [Terriglobales bacterium]|nr:ATP-binding cassette domain-containing protein [Terriglobales bacterium]
MTHTTPVVESSNVSYVLPDGRKILQELTFKAHQGEILVLLGRSGSGKTTALKLINRLLEVSSGQLRVDGRPTKDWDVIELRRHIGYAIQEVGLFPHYTVARNIALVPSIQNWPKEKTAARVQELLRLVGLNPDLASRYPHQLSGGQRQRVGVARALAADPPILLMDEPFGALDPLTRSDLQREFLSLQQQLGKTVLFVTHDLHEALRLGTRIALLEEGRLVSLTSANEFLTSSEPLVKKYVEAFGTTERQPEKP